MEVEIASLKSDVEHIKEDTTEIKQSIAAFVAQAAKTSVEIESLRGRMRECEHDIIALKADTKNIKNAIWRIGTILALVASGVSVGVEKILK